MMKLFIKFLKDESGQTSTEYILLVAVVAIVIFKFKKQMSDGLDKVTGTVFSKADELANQIGTTP